MRRIMRGIALALTYTVMLGALIVMTWGDVQSWGPRVVVLVCVGLIGLDAFWNGESGDAWARSAPRTRQKGGRPWGG